MQQPRAVVLLSGGLDSATTLAIAKQQFACYSLSFDYGQCAQAELVAARNVAAQFKVLEHRVATIDLGAFGGSALTDSALDIPHSSHSVELANNAPATDSIPITYVPARNTIFLSYALAWAEVLNAQAIFIGVNAVDYSGYPDCRPEYITAFQTLANLATKRAIEGDKLDIHTPLINSTKAEIIQLGEELKVDYSQTISCYQADASGAACGCCDSCFLRREGFKQAGIADPTRYQA